MIMARRLTLEGADVVGMFEILPFISGLRRNLVQCVRDFGIPLRLCTTVTEVKGRARVEAVLTSRVDAHFRPVPGTQEEVTCDTLLLSVGLIPENELSRLAGVRIDPITGGPRVDERYATSIPGVFAAGNVVHVYDLADEVTASALRAGRCAAEYALGKRPAPTAPIGIIAGENVRHVVPQVLHPSALTGGAVSLQFRVRQPIEETVHAEVRAGEEVLVSKRLRYVRPAEMVILELEPAFAEPIERAGSLRVDIVR